MNDTEAPRNIIRFETIQIISILIGLLFGYASSDSNGFDVTCTEFFILALTLFVSRGRKNWARWILIAFFGIGLIVMIIFSPIIIRNLSIPSGLSVVAQFLLQAMGVALLLSQESSRWLRQSSFSTRHDIN